MAGTKILVLGGTGLAGLNILRELIYRKQHGIAYARNPSKIPADISESAYIEIIQGDFSVASEPALSRAVSQSKVIISMLGPIVSLDTFRHLTPTFFADVYEHQIFPLMRQHSVRRIFVMSTVSVYQPDDKFSFVRWLAVQLVWLLANIAQKNIFAIQDLFEDPGRCKDIDGTAYRLGTITGGADAQSWRADREGETYDGPVAGQGWSILQKRGQLAKWLVEAAVDGRPDLIGRQPAVSRYAGSKGKTK